MGINNEPSHVKVLVAVPGLDCHERAIWAIAGDLRDAGVEVVYLGCFQTPERIAATAVQEDVDAIVLSYHLDGFYREYFPRVVQLLEDMQVGYIPVIGGGHIDEGDKPSLEKIGVKGLYGPGTPMKVVIDHIKQIAMAKKREMAEVGS